MSRFFRTIVVAHAALLTLAVGARAASTPPAFPPDSRWDPYLGCWAVDTIGTGRQSSSGVTCIVPIAGSRGVEALTFARGKVVARDRLDSSGEPHTVSGQGCHGFETTGWSTSGRRVFLRSDYVCGSTKGSSSTIYAIAPGGDWLRVEQVRSGGGVSVSLERRRPVALASEVSAEAAREIEDRQMAIATARAAAAAPITTDEIVEAVHTVDPGVVRSWVIVSGQSFYLDGASINWLIQSDVPQSVLSAMMPADQVAVPALERATYYGGAPVYTGPTAYANATVSQPEQPMYQQQCPYGQNPYNGCNVVPNPYSILNGYGLYPFGMGFSPFTSVFPGGFLINRFTNNRAAVIVRKPIVRHDGHDGHDGHPVRGPVVVTGGGGRRR